MQIGKFVIGVAGLLVGLLIGEGFLSLLAPQVHRKSRLWEHDARLGWRHVPGAVGEMVSPEFAVEVSINEDGLRDRNYPQERSADTWRLLAFGDSFVEGWGVSLGASVSKQLEAALRKQISDRRVEVINFGTAGYGTDQELLFYEGLGRQYEPDDVLVFFYANDLWNNTAKKGIGAERGYKPYFRIGRGNRLSLGGVPVAKIPSWDPNWVERLPWKVRLERYLQRHWHLYALLGKMYQAPEVDAQQRRNYYEGLYGAGVEEYWQPLWELTGRLLQTFQERVHKEGARMLLVYVPAIVQIEEDDWRTKQELHDLVGTFDMEKPNKRLASFAHQYGIRFVDLYPAFKEASRDRVLYMRDSHWNEDGHALAAEVIAGFLADEPGGTGEPGE